ncbi:MAG TPA: hypothetical protein PKH24_21585 [Sedimentisphaerales bacterium]|jgi:hypothetical protein|nr:hypothetical protein [Sedimentisphaerales bacterium]HNU31783.1 hypothetical protein [Sedimentisphaerales bacterium]
MKSAEDMKQRFRQSTLSVNQDRHEAIFAEILRVQEQSQETKPAGVRPMNWRRIMRSPSTKLGVAAAVLIACGIGLSLWQTTGSGIALADVLTRIEQVTGYAYQVSSTLTWQRITSKWTSTVLVSKEDGIKMTVTASDYSNTTQKALLYRHAVGDESFLLPRANSLIEVHHGEKTYMRHIYDGVKLDYYKEQYNDPHAIVKEMLNYKHTSLGHSVIDGVTVEGFQITDAAYGGAFFVQADHLGDPDKVDVKLWVDVNTFLPVRLEEDVVTKEGARLRDVSYDFRWNVIVTPDDFKPNIPEDYRPPVGDIIHRPFDEENAIKGLKLFDDAVGRYPASIEDRTLVEEWMKHTGYDPNSYKELSDEERSMRTNELISISAPALFYMSLVQSKADPAYCGQTVGPKDADKVLLRWKLNDGQYRVIFGDLHAETVSPEKLAELEKALPK